MGKPRRYHEDDYKLALVCLVVKQGYAISHVSGIFKIDEGMIRRWIKTTADSALIQRISLEQSQQQLEKIVALTRQVTDLRNENSELQKAVGQLYIKLNTKLNSSSEPEQ